MTNANMIQIAVLAATVGAGGLFVKFQSAANAQEVREVSEKHGTDNATMRGRVRGLEVDSAVRAANIEAIRDDISKVQEGQKETNSLLRQIAREIGKSN